MPEQAPTSATPPADPSEGVVAAQTSTPANTPIGVPIAAPKTHRTLMIAVGATLLVALFSVGFAYIYITETKRCPAQIIL